MFESPPVRQGIPPVTREDANGSMLQGILRVRICLAQRSRYYAQDDKTKTAVRPKARSIKPEALFGVSYA
jgi:hypothetical protein